MIQWLGSLAFTPRDLGSIPSQGTKILQAIWWGGQKKEIIKISQNGFVTSNSDMVLPSNLCKSGEVKNLHIHTFFTFQVESERQPLTPLYLWHDVTKGRYLLKKMKENVTQTCAGREDSLSVDGSEWNIGCHWRSSKLKQSSALNCMSPQFTRLWWRY